MTIWETVLARLGEIADRQDDLHRKVDQILARDGAAPGQQDEPGTDAQPPEA